MNAFFDNPLTKINDNSREDFEWEKITGKNDITINIPRNKNISNIWKYDSTKISSTYCITGEEATCQEIETPETYESGTILKYRVNNTLELYFHVMFDNKDTLTLQQRENTIYSISWYETANSNSKGPLTVLPAIENVAKDWTNVLNQTYTLGSTVFKDNAYTGCNRNTSYTMLCSAKTYTLGKRTAKARLISVQEANALGCYLNTSGQCPAWMINYLYDSIKYGGTENRTGGEYGMNYGYWTMNAYSGRTTDSCYVSSSMISMDSSNNIHYGARAVVVIRK